MNTILVTGGNGQLGTELKRHRWPDGWGVIAVDIADLDLRDPASVAAMIGSRRWAGVINAAAFTAVDRAETEIASAWAVNATGPAALAEACARHGIPIVQISTDYVFDGTRDGGWETDHAPAPLNVYGASKLAGEIAVRASGATHAIVRTSWLVSAQGSNFVRTMLRLAAERDVVRVVDDQYGAPTGAADLAAIVATIAIGLASEPDRYGHVFHASNTGETTWCGVARAIFAGSAARGGPSASVEPITTADYPTAARRPAHSLLSHSALGDIGIVPRGWQAALDDILDELLGKATS